MELRGSLPVATLVLFSLEPSLRNPLRVMDWPTMVRNFCTCSKASQLAPRVASVGPSVPVPLALLLLSSSTARAHRRADPVVGGACAVVLGAAGWVRPFTPPSVTCVLLGVWNRHRPSHPPPCNLHPPAFPPTPFSLPCLPPPPPTHCRCQTRQDRADGFVVGAGASPFSCPPMVNPPSSYGAANGGDGGEAAGGGASSRVAGPEGHARAGEFLSDCVLGLSDGLTVPCVGCPSHASLLSYIVGWLIVFGAF